MGTAATLSGGGLDEIVRIGDDVVERYQRDGFVQLRHVLAPEVVEEYRAAIVAASMRLTKERRKLEERDTYGKAFLQIINLWEQDEAVRRFCFSKRLASIAAQLMRVDAVRMYHDQALHKEAGGGHTPWHTDQHYWPLSDDRCVTAWVPLVPVSREMGPLSFAAGSHRADYGRELAISDESERLIDERIRAAGARIHEEPFDLGDVSFHAGWTFHRAGPNRTDRDRLVMTVIYMADGMRRAAPRDPRIGGDRDIFCPGRAVGEVMDTHRNPILYDARA